MKEITVQELQEKIDKNEDFQLIDVREPFEVDIATIGGENIPMAQVPKEIEKISKKKTVVVYCRSGGRSGNIVQWLTDTHGFENAHNLKGGILAWSDEIDQAITKY